MLYMHTGRPIACYRVNALAKYKGCWPHQFLPSLPVAYVLLRLAAVNNWVRCDRRRGVVPITIVQEVDLRNTLLHALHEIIEQTQTVRVRRLAVRDASERDNSIVQQEANVGGLVARSGRGR